MSRCETIVHVGTLGFDIVVQFLNCDGSVLDLLAENYSVLSLLLKSPSGVKTTKVASFVTDGSDGLIHYLTVAADLNEAGVWKLQGKVEDVGPSKTLYSEVGSFKVKENLEP